MAIEGIIIGLLVGIVIGAWWQLRAADRAYRLALDHVEEMTRPGWTSYTLPEALAKLREETKT